ncbi:hypothetical protein DXG01_010194 [Tephrocybe rancida]|nr:hypothetical protein DXG01_010194 [Tephrocybe rancida]
MGRALFSTNYAPVVAVHTEPDVHADIPRCERWSISNPFDPDSDEFCQSATREVFTDTEAWRQEQEAVRELLVAQARSAESPASSDTSESDAESPMAVGPDDPALLIADAYPISDMDVSWTPHGEFLSTVATENATPPSFSPPRSPTLRRAHAIASISIPNEPSSPSPASPASPSTPTDDIYHREIMTMLTPSPVPSVTPHLYTWYRVAPLAAPASPLANMSAAGPLTNPSARMSLAHLNIAPARVRAQNAAV